MIKLYLIITLTFNRRDEPFLDITNMLDIELENNNLRREHGGREKRMTDRREKRGTFCM